MRSYLQPEEVYQRFEPLLHHFSDSVYESVAQVNAIRALGNTQYRNSCIADMLHDHISSELRQRLDSIGSNGLSLNKNNQLFNIKVGDFALITLHKLNRKTLRPPEPKTLQSITFEKQGDCFSHGEKLTNLYFGYTLDSTYTQVSGIYFLLSVNGETKWVLDLLNNTSEGLGNIDFPTAPEPTQDLPTERRVRIKDDKKKRATA